MELDLTRAIINICKAAEPEGAGVEDCAEKLHLKGEQLPELFAVFADLVRSGKLMKIHGDQYGAAKHTQEIIGIYKGYTDSFGFLLTEAEQEDIYIGERYRHTAMNNDKVAVRILPSAQRRHRQEGEVVRILERANTRIIGTFMRERGGCFVHPDDERIHEDIYIPEAQTGAARSGARVAVTVTTWPTEKRKAEGTVTEIIGYDGDRDLAVKVIMAQHDLPFAFPPEVLQEAQSLSTKVSLQEGRTDYRNRRLITIDSEDAKDLDDAIDIERLPNGTYRLGVYIADVGYYVRPHTALDREAYARGTSVYLVDRVVPMLPEALSNGICSLNAQEDRYAMACVMDINRQGRVEKAKIGPAVIRVARRCNYTEIKKALCDSIVPDDLAPFLPALRQLQEVTTWLKEMRMRRGALDFDFPEYKIILDAEGTPLRLDKWERTIAEQIVEESMLIANETVGTYLKNTKNPSVYRVHEKPEAARMEMLRTVLSGFSLPFPTGTDPQPADFQALLTATRGTPEEAVVQMMTLRSLQQARYDIQNLGHFGLASVCYTHFTSPIRRYPDLLVHRLLRQYWQKGRLSEAEAAHSAAFYTTAAEQASMRERIAVEAERETEAVKKAQYMMPFIGEPFQAHITGLAPFGMFVGLENGIEGLIHISYLTEDVYTFDETTYTLRGTYGGHVYHLGDALEVTLARVNMERCEIDFVPGTVDGLADLQKLLAAGEARRKKTGRNRSGKDKIKDKPRGRRGKNGNGKGKKRSGRAVGRKKHRRSGK